MKQTPAGKEKVVYKSKIFEIVQQKFSLGKKQAIFEFARRAPGTRLLIIKNGKIFLTREYRWELASYDFRLPGGKVFDTLAEFYAALKTKQQILLHARRAARRECIEETGLIPASLKHIHTTSSGATVSWDLYYFLIDAFKPSRHGQRLEDGEVIEPIWKTFAEVKKMCLNNKIKEERSVAVLLRFILTR